MLQGPIARTVPVVFPLGNTPNLAIRDQLLEALRDCKATTSMELPPAVEAIAKRKIFLCIKHPSKKNAELLPLIAIFIHYLVGSFQKKPRIILVVS